MLIRGLCCGILVVILSLIASRKCLDMLPKKVRDHFSLVVPEPPWLEDAIRKQQAPRLSAGDLKALKDDGVVFVRGLLKGDHLMAELRRRMWLHADMPFQHTDINQKTWLWNGAVRALLRDGPLGDLLQQAFGQEGGAITINEAPIWGYNGRRFPALPNPWHTDARFPGGNLYSIWLVLTSGPVALEFLRGSHVAREEIEEACARPVLGGKAGFKRHDSECVHRFFSVLEKNFSMEGSSLLSEPLKAGDAFLFSGDVLHRGMLQQYSRIALSLRAGWLQGRLPGCNWEHPQIHPSNIDMKHDFDCSPWVLLPGFPRWSPRLSAGSVGASFLRLLERS
uniref:Phytanoyl-CoA dioxygenase n=1 Tax=Alexandrium catenella TaxID=2925 RepID=A0A7S1QNE0_ALECA